MTLDNLSNLARIGQLNEEPPNLQEFDGFLKSAKDRLHDVANNRLSYAGRFDLVYNAAHALALAALRNHGYRSDKRYLVFQCLMHTVSLSQAKVQVFAICHDRRNRAEYEGHFEVDEQLLSELIELSNELLERVSKMTASE